MYQNWLVHQCTLMTYCCAYRGDGDGQNYDCCDDHSRVSDAGPANYEAGNNFQFAPGQIYSTAAPLTRTAASISLITVTATASSTWVSSAPRLPSPGLSTNAKAGIGVGVGIFAVVMVGVMIYAFICCKRRNRKGMSGTSSADRIPWLEDEVPAKENLVNAYELPTEPGSHPRMEL